MRRKIDTGIYNQLRLKEKPIPATKFKRVIKKKMAKRQGNTHTNTMPSTYQCNTPPSSPTPLTSFTTPPPSPRLPNPPPTAPSANENNSDTRTPDTSSTEDVICTSDVTCMERHRPIREFDVLSGRHRFNNTVSFI